MSDIFIAIRMHDVGKRKSPSHFLWSLHVQERNKSLNSPQPAPTEQWCCRIHQKTIKRVFCSYIALFIYITFLDMLLSIILTTIQGGREANVIIYNK